MLGMNKTSPIKFQNVIKIYSGSTLQTGMLRKLTAGKEHMLYFFRLTPAQMFGIYIEKDFPQDWDKQIDTESGNVSVIEQKSNKFEMQI